MRLSCQKVLPKHFTWTVGQVGGPSQGGVEESYQNQENKDFCQLSFRVNIARMPVMGVLGGGGGRLQRSSSVGRGDVEARTLAPAQPPRRAHSFR